MAEGFSRATLPPAVPKMLWKTQGPDCLLLQLVLFASLLFAQTLAGQCLLGASFLTRFHVETMLLDFLDNVFLLHLALESTQCVFKRLAFLYDDFSHARIHLPSLLSQWASSPLSCRVGLKRRPPGALVLAKA